MKNPLRKRVLREFAGELGKYFVIFVFMAGTIGFVSGFLVAGGSMMQAYEESFEKYRIEDGHFLLYDEAKDAQIDEMERAGVKIYPDYYLEEPCTHDAEGVNDSTLRIYKVRQEINKVCLMDGKMPESSDEIALDRMYADNNRIQTGDILKCGKKECRVSGLIALSDYSALFSDNGDLMFDAVKFGVAVVTEEGFSDFGDTSLHYSYSWKYDRAPESEAEEVEKSDDFLDVLARSVRIENYVPRYANQAIQFTGDDMGSDRTMMLVLLYILIVILAFVFSVTINHTIVKEAPVIGTLRALGYTKGELLRHYLALPLIVTLLAAAAGNILGYTVFKNVVVGMYYGSYSLPTYQTVWNGEAFVLTTLVPLFIMLLTNLVLLMHRLSLSPLQFIRRDLTRKSRKKAVKLPSIGFFHRFRLRIILQNRSSYFMLFVGIVFANILLLFGMMLSPLLVHYQKETIAHMMAEYQYILKFPAEVEEEAAEKYCVTSLVMTEGSGEGVSVYGIEADSAYVKEELPEDGVLISDGLAEKYRIDEGDVLELKEAYGEERYTFVVKGIYTYPAAFSALMTNEQYREIFDVNEGGFNGYFSNKELEELDENMVASCITEDDLTKVSRQLDVSMGKMFYMVDAFAVVLYVLLIYLLTKLILEKNTNAISMVKILGYKNKEIAGLYLLATTWIVIFSLAASLAIATRVISLIYFEMMKGFSGWLTLYVEPRVYGEMFLIGLVSYLAVAAFGFRRIRKIPMDEALKNIE